jgi:hypothetical protein
LGKLESAGGPERTEFFRVFDRDIPSVTIAELLFDLVSKITSAHYEVANPLVTQLSN